MVLFFPIEQELDCISKNGRILGKIQFDVFKDQYFFTPNEESLVLTDEEESCIVARLAGLEAGIFSFAMQDED